MGDFLNEFASNFHAIGALVVLVLLGLPVFSVFYNGIVASDKLGQRSLYVIGGVLVTLAAGALFSWKAALMYLILFALSGFYMAVGDYQRGRQKASQPTPNKRASYKVNGLVSETAMAAEEASRYLTQALKKRTNEVDVIALISMAQNELTTIRLHLKEVQQIRKEG
jgi:hypothetical protein